MDGGLLMANQDVLDLILLEEFVIYMQNRTTRVAENVLDLFFLEAPDYNLRTGQCHCF